MGSWGVTPGYAERTPLVCVWPDWRCLWLGRSGFVGDLDSCFRRNDGGGGCVARWGIDFRGVDGNNLGLRSYSPVHLRDARVDQQLEMVRLPRLFGARPAGIRVEQVPPLAKISLSTVPNGLASAISPDGFCRSVCT